MTNQDLMDLLATALQQRGQEVAWQYDGLAPSLVVADDDGDIHYVMVTWDRDNREATA